MPLGRNITRRFGFGRNPAAEAIPQNGRKDISLPLNLITTDGFFDDVMGGDGSFNSSAKDDQRTSTSSADDKAYRPDSSSGSPTTGTPSLTDASSVENSPADVHSFLSPTLPDLEPTEPRGLFAGPTDAPPAIPKRVPSHSKKEHVRLARKRSLRSSDTTVTAATPSPSKPAFSAGPTLEEEPLLEVDEDSRFDVAYMREHGLRRFSASAYMNELPTISPFADDGTTSWI